MNPRIQNHGNMLARFRDEKREILDDMGS